MKYVNLMKVFIATAILAGISITSISSNSQTEVVNEERTHRMVEVTSSTEQTSASVFSRIGSKINSLLSNPKVIIGLIGINLPNHSN